MKIAGLGTSLQLLIIITTVQPIPKQEIVVYGLRWKSIIVSLLQSYPLKTLPCFPTLLRLKVSQLVGISIRRMNRIYDKAARILSVIEK